MVVRRIEAIDVATGPCWQIQRLPRRVVMKR
jgi:hypothetical protein